MIDRPPGWVLFRRVPLLCQLRPQWEDPDVFLQHLRSVLNKYLRKQCQAMFAIPPETADTKIKIPSQLLVLVLFCDVLCWFFFTPPDWLSLLLLHPLTWSSRPQRSSLRSKCDWVVPRVTLTHIFHSRLRFSCPFMDICGHRVAKSKWTTHCSVETLLIQE